MTISVDPRLFGSPVVSWVSLLTLVAIAVGLAIVMRQAAELGLSKRDVYAIGLRSVLWGLLGARLLHVVDYAGFYADAPFRVFYAWQGGLALWGAVLAGSAGALWHARRRGANVGRFADTLAVAGLAGMAVGRVGDFIAGERLGTPTSLPWGVEYAHPRSEAFMIDTAVHPVALYELLAGLLVLGMLLRFLWLRRTLPTDSNGSGLGARVNAWIRGAPEGAGLVAALSAYAAGRFVTTFARVNPTHGGLQEAQWVALVVLAAVGFYTWRLRRSGVI